MSKAPLLLRFFLLPPRYSTHRRLCAAEAAQSDYETRHRKPTAYAYITGLNVRLRGLLLDCPAVVRTGELLELLHDRLQYLERLACNLTRQQQGGE